MKRVVTYGLETATDHTIAFLGRYLLVELVPILWLTWTFRSWIPGIGVTFALFHVFSLAVLIPGSLLISGVAMRVARSRTWDLQPWRPWVGAILAVALEFGYFITGNLSQSAPEILRQAVGYDAAGILHYVGVLAFTSAIGQIAAWLVPHGRARR